MVFVRAGTGEQAEFAAEAWRQYTPIAMDATFRHGSRTRLRQTPQNQNNDSLWV
jgi:hypothetical protein